MDNREILKKGLEKYNIEATMEIIERFEVYKDMLLEWNQKINLTAITDEREIVVKHFLDSASCMAAGIDFSNVSVIDVGTGAGFPGIPLKIINQGMELTLLDSLNKRLIFLTELMNKLGLKANIVHGRAEEFGVKKEFREKFNVAVSRAVASMNVLLEYTLPFVKQGGFLLCQKGPSIFEEMESSKKAMEILGGRMDKILSTEVYNSDFTHYIVKIEKVKLCPANYPRKAGTAEKKPII